jgi:hypothetical protein
MKPLDIREIKVSCKLAFGIFVLVCLAGPIISSADQERSGVILSLQGRADLIVAVGGASQKLDPRTDLLRVLFAGETLRLDPGATADLLIGDQKKTIAGPCEFTVPTIATAETSKEMQAIDELSQLGGRKRASKTAIYSPAAESVVWAENLVFRWIPQKGTGFISLVIEDENGTTLWRKDAVPDSDGILDSDEARKVLAKLQGEVSLNMITLGGDRIEVPFGLLSAERKGALDHDLDLWGQQENPILKHIGRACVYAKYEMFNQVADEYEKALESAPQSRTLLDAAISAHHRIGNALRETELRRRLPAARTRPSPS